MSVWWPGKGEGAPKPRRPMDPNDPRIQREGEDIDTYVKRRSAENPVDAIQSQDPVSVVKPSKIDLYGDLYGGGLRSTDEIFRPGRPLPVGIYTRQSGLSKDGLYSGDSRESLGGGDMLTDVLAKLGIGGGGGLRQPTPRTHGQMNRQALLRLMSQSRTK